MRQTPYVIPYISSTSDNIFNFSLKCELDTSMTIFDQILEVSPCCTDSTYLISAILVTLP